MVKEHMEFECEQCGHKFGITGEASMFKKYSIHYCVECGSSKLKIL